MNMNQLAKEVAKREGLKVELPIGQIKEVLRVLVEVFFENQCAIDCMNKAINKRVK